MGSGSVSGELARLRSLPDDEIDLARISLLVAATEYPRLDVDVELGVLDSLAAGAARRLEAGREPLASTNDLSEYLFDEVGFRGNSEDYYDPRNSFLNDVLSRRLGIPITLSLVYIEVGKRLAIPLAGVGMPGHFLVKHLEVADLFIDPFHGGILLSEEECARRVEEVTQSTVPWNSRYLDPVSNREFVARIVRNLKGTYLRQQDYARSLAMIDWLVALQPGQVQERRDRGLVHYQLGHIREAFEDLKVYVASEPTGADTEAMQELAVRLEALLDD